MKNPSISVIALAIASLYAPAFAQTSTPPPSTLPVVTVIGTPLKDPSFQTDAANDTAQLLSEHAGYSVATGGGVSGLPIVNGLADDRLKIRLDGMEITSACANHMNSPLSYADPKQISNVMLIAGVTPVSVGGDNIGGTIEAETTQPIYAASDAGLLTTGNVSLTGRSVNHGLSVGAAFTVANENLNFSYNGSQSRAQSYRAGNGEKVLDTLYKSSNQSLLFAARSDDQQLTLRVGEQRIPYQGYPNQYMDMTGNHGRYANLGYDGALGTVTLNGKLYWQKTTHDMGFFSSERSGKMPMNTEGKNYGYSLKADFPFGGEDHIRVGNEYHAFRLNDYWPAVAGSMMMGPLTYININQGTRNRLAFFGEWEHRTTTEWTTLLGLRDEIVKMDSGDVQPYAFNMMNGADAAAANDFNQRNHARRDNNIDVTALAKYEANESSIYELGLARKTRSPNLYERYTWGRGTMAMTMTNWFGDGNGYVGNLELKPEIAYSLNASADWHNADKTSQLKVSPYYTRVHDYIDVDVIGHFHPYMVMNAQGNLLQFANHDATLYGINLSWMLPVYTNADWGRFNFKGIASITHGSRNDGGDLYRMMPFTSTLTLEHIKGSWISAAEAVITNGKSRIDMNRLEPDTAGYTLLNLRTGYEVSKNIRITGGVSNVFDKHYDLPLGGVNLAALANSRNGELQPVPGYGRSIDIGVTIGF